MIKILKCILLIFSTLLISGCSFIVSRVIPLNDIKSPTGNYKVGTQIFYWTDNDREEWFTDIEGDKRELVIQVWYPSSGENNAKVGWIDNPSIRTNAIIDKFDVPKFIAKAIDRVDTDSFLNANPIEKGSFPVIIFSHGFEGFRSQNTTQIQELASNGYIVFSVDHTYDAVLTILEDGRTISPAEKYCYGCEAEEFYDIFIPQINTRISDMRFLIDQIEKLKTAKIESNFSHLMDIDRLGIFGHSFGGGTSLAVTILDPRIKSCLSLDGWYVPIHPDIYEKGLSKPFLHLGQVAWDEAINYEILDKILESKEGIGYKLSLKGAHHYDFTDSPHLSKLASSFKLSSDLDSQEILDVTNTAVIGFFNTHLKSVDNNWLDKIKSKGNTIIRKFNDSQSVLKIPEVSSGIKQNDTSNE